MPPEYLVDLVRKEWYTATVRVDAKDSEEALDLALDMASDDEVDFYYDESETEISDWEECSEEPIIDGNQKCIPGDPGLMGEPDVP